MDLQYDFAKKAKPLPPSRNNSKAKENSVVVVDLDSSDEDIFIASSAATGRIPTNRRNSQPATLIKTDDLRKR